MDRLPLFLVVVLVFFAGVPGHSRAGGPIPPSTDAHVARDDCHVSPRATMDLSPACGTRKGPLRLVVSFQARDTVKAFVGCRAGISFWFQSRTIPSWWHFGAGGCRSGALTIASPDLLSGSCANPYAGVAASHQLTFPSLQNGHPMGNTVVETSLKTPDGEPAPVDLPPLPPPGGGYVAFVLEIASGDGACEGCEVPACITVHPLDVYTKDGLWARYYPESIATWQRGAQCGAVSARPYTWGQIKALYR